MITIITRTHDRPEMLKRNIESIKKQTYKKIIHLIVADNEKAEKYAKELNPEAIVIRVKKSSDGKAFYNLYLNEAMKHVKEGWMMFVDDDDYLINPNCIKELMKAMKDDKLVYICRFRRGERLKPAKAYFKKINYTAGENKQIKSGKIGGSCIVFRPEQIKGSKWDDNYSSDYRFIKQMTNRNDYKFVANCIVQATAQCNRGTKKYF